MHSFDHAVYFTILYTIGVVMKYIELDAFVVVVVLIIVCHTFYDLFMTCVPFCLSEFAHHYTCTQYDTPRNFTSKRIIILHGGQIWTITAYSNFISEKNHFNLFVTRLYLW